ncbi:hypothetical protein FRC03_012289 [Tulasnella sp. 419]|nr:hypothetical protein FRC02_007300 [Tulasnella sp. 418]KAG8952057.1 hypothetical protein FRC03_012289 [Tulasnella sp. 419]
MSVPLHSVHAQPFPYSIQETQVGSSSINVSLKRDPSADQPQRPAKRSRKAINCEPCRQSKLKCDRGKPCSGCVLRGTSAQCYADSPNNYDSTSSCGREDQGPRIDPRAEITRIRNSLLAIEQHINRSSSSSSPSQPASSNYPSRSDSLAPTSLPPISYLSTSISPDYQRHNNTASLDVNADNSPSAFRPENGIYIGPTSTASHLLSLRNGEQRGTTTSDVNGEEQYSAMAEGAPFGKLDDPSPLPVHQVDELLEHLPDTSEELISYYFENCTWLHRNLHQETFLKAWARFNNSASRPGGHIILATAFGILGIAVQYLPPNHTLFETSPDSQNDIANQYHRMAETAYRRHLLDTREPSLEVVEYLLIKAQFLHITKHDLEQVWAVRGELLSIGLAMGLHRDPGKWKMSREVKERRRWAWWNILVSTNSMHLHLHV